MDNRPTGTGKLGRHATRAATAHDGRHAPAPAPQYIFEAADKPSLPLVEVPLIEATDESVRGYGCLVHDAADCEIEIVRWPARGWRPVDADSGDEGGIAEGVFCGEWAGES